jgi:hypothetical protein
MVKMGVNGMDGWMQSRCNLSSRECPVVKYALKFFGTRVGMKYKNPSNVHLTNTYDKDESEWHGWI